MASGSGPALAVIGPLDGGVRDHAGDEGDGDGGGAALRVPQEHRDGGAEVDVAAEHGRKRQHLGRTPRCQAVSKALWKMKVLRKLQIGIFCILRSLSESVDVNNNFQKKFLSKTVEPPTHLHCLL